MEWGLRAAFRLIRTYIRYKIDTPAAIVRRWAPPSENHTDAYIATVGQRSGLDVNQALRFSDRDKVIRLVAAMAWVESVMTIDQTTLNRAYDKA